MRRLSIGLGLLLIGACSLSAAEAIPETKEGLQQQMSTLMSMLKAGHKEHSDTLLKVLVLPNQEDWFKKNFGPELGATMAQQYGAKQADLPQEVGALLAKAQSSDVVTDVCSKGSDATATGLQKKALEALKNPVSLYTAKVGGMSLWSFVYVDGAFHLIGKLPALK